MQKKQDFWISNSTCGTKPQTDLYDKTKYKHNRRKVFNSL